MKLPVYLAGMLRDRRWLYECLLIGVYSIAAMLIHYCYPVPQISWDSNYYIVTGATGELGIRPNGYAVFLDLLHLIHPRLGLVVFVQFGLYYLGVRFFIEAVSSATGFPLLYKSLFTAFLLLEPVSLFHCNAILSDSLFTSLSLMSIATLVLLLRTGRWLWLPVHLLLVMSCIEVRHIALFYPFFSCFAVVVWGGGWRSKSIAVAAILAVYFACFAWHISQHNRTYGVAVYSPFSGWTHANNALYAVREIAPAEIGDQEVRGMHEEFLRLINERNFTPAFIGSGFLWEDDSPLNIIRQRVIDSSGADYTRSWFLCAERFGEYGTYIQRHFPTRYFRAFMVPNLRTMYTPAHGEMESYSITHLISPVSLERYGITTTDLEPRKHPYERRINPYLIYLYRAQLWIFLLSCLAFVARFRYWEAGMKQVTSLLICFVFIMYGLTLYSSWFMYRYLMPVTPVMWTVSVTMIMSYRKIISGRQTVRPS